MTRENDFYFIHISDTHITPPRSGLYAGEDTAQNFNRVIAAAFELDVDPAFIVVSGDLSDNGEVESYVRLACLVAEVEERGIPVLLALGNHDNRDNFYSVSTPTGTQRSIHDTTTAASLATCGLSSWTPLFMATAPVTWAGSS